MNHTPSDDSAQPSSRFEVTAERFKQLTNIGTAQRVNFYGGSPPPPPVFEVARAKKLHVNHEEPLRLLLRGEAALREAENGPCVLVVEGAAGVGKKQTVRFWAQVDLVERFPDGALCVDLDDHSSQGRVDLAAVQARLASAFMSAGDPPATPQDAERRWLSRSRDKRFLLVLENMNHPALLPELLPPSDSAVVVAVTRFDLAEFLEHDPLHVPVRPFDATASRELLDRCGLGDRLEAEPDATRTLIARCDGRPEALHSVARHLRRRSSLTVSQACERLEPLLSAAGSLEAATAAGAFADEISPQARELLRKLTALPGRDFPPELATALAGSDRAVTLLSELEQAGLVLRIPDGRVRTPEVVRRVVRADAAADAESTAAALRESMRWWRRAARRADVAVSGAARLRVRPCDVVDDDLPEAVAQDGSALDWLARYLPSLSALAREAARRGWHDEVIDLAESLWALFDNQVHPADHQAVLQLALAAARDSHDDRALAHFQTIQALRLNREQADAPAALEAARSALHSAMRTDDPRLIASVHDVWGNILRKTGRPVEALEHLKFALDENRRLGHIRGSALMNRCCGETLADLGRWKEAETRLAEAVEMFRRLDLGAHQARALIPLARVYSAMSDPAAALRSLDAALELLIKERAEFHIAQCHETRADVYAAVGDAEAAAQWLENALGLHSLWGDMQSQAAQRLLRKLNA